MKLIALYLFFIGFLMAVLSSMMTWFPTNKLMEYFMDSHGRYPVAQVYGGTFLFYFLPAAFALMLDNFLGKRKK